MHLLKESTESSYPLVNQQFQGLAFLDNDNFIGTSLISSTDFYQYNFSYCLFKNVTISECEFYDCTFYKYVFDNIVILNSTFSGNDLNSIEIKNMFYSYDSSFGYSVRIPNKIVLKLLKKLYIDSEKAIFHDRESLTKLVTQTVDHKFVIEKDQHLAEVINSLGFALRYGIVTDCLNLEDLLDICYFSKEYNEDGTRIVTEWYEKQFLSNNPSV